MSLEVGIEEALKVLRWYGDRNNYQDDIPGEATLFGCEPDAGKRAEGAIVGLENALKSAVKQRRELENARAEGSGTIRADVLGNALYFV